MMADMARLRTMAARLKRAYEIQDEAKKQIADGEAKLKEGWRLQHKFHAMIQKEFGEGNHAYEQYYQFRWMLKEQARPAGFKPDPIELIVEAQTALEGEDV